MLTIKKNWHGLLGWNPSSVFV